MGKGEGWFVKKVIQSLVYCDTAQGTYSAVDRTLLISSVQVATYYIHTAVGQQLAGR